MSRKLLENLNGTNKGYFKKWLDNFDGEPRIYWYPSAGTDFRDILFLSPQYLEYKPQPTHNPPDFFIFSDYYPWTTSTFLDTRTIWKDEHTLIDAEVIEKLPKCNLSFCGDLVYVDRPRHYGTSVFILMKVKSDILGEFTVPTMYVFVENAAFAAEKILPYEGKISHLMYHNWGLGLGGGRMPGSWIKNILRRVECKYACFWNPEVDSHLREILEKSYPVLLENSGNYTMESLRTEIDYGSRIECWNRVIYE